MKSSQLRVWILVVSDVEASKDVPPLPTVTSFFGGFEDWSSNTSGVRIDYYSGTTPVSLTQIS